MKPTLLCEYKKYIQNKYTKTGVLRWFFKYRYLYFHKCLENCITENITPQAGICFVTGVADLKVFCLISGGYFLNLDFATMGN